MTENDEPKGAPVIKPGHEHAVLRELASSAKWQAREAKELLEDIDRDIDQMEAALAQLHDARRRVQSAASHIYEKVNEAERKLANVQGIREGLPSLIASLEELEEDEDA